MSTIQQFNFDVPILPALLWQDNVAASTESLVVQKQLWYDQYHKQFWLDWLVGVFDLVSCGEFGLSVWSIILGLPLEVGLPAHNGKIFGFGPDVGPPATNNFVNFNHGNFANPGSAFSLTIPEQRLLLRLRYFKLCSRGAIPEMNRFLNIVFAHFVGDTFTKGDIYVVDGLRMFIRVVFKWSISARIIYLLRYFDLIPRNSGVRIEYVVTAGKIFGFGPDSGPPNTNGFVNFNNGNFARVY